MVHKTYGAIEVKVKQVRRCVSIIQILNNKSLRVTRKEGLKYCEYI